MIKVKKTNCPFFVIMILSPIPFFSGLILVNGVNTNNKSSKGFTIVNNPQDNKWRATKDFKEWKKILCN